jgi:hypothetical protein
MRKWGMPVYLDAGSHINIDDKPCYFCGIFNLYKLAHTIRANIHQPSEYKAAEERFLQAREKLLAEGGGVVSIVYHPCEFVHNEFWDGANFLHGANPPRENWRLPKTKTAEESKAAYQVFENYVRFMKRFPEVQFITATEAAKVYRDKARGRSFSAQDLEKIAAAVTTDLTYQKQNNEYTLAASEVFVLLNEYVVERSAGRTPDRVELKRTPYGPSSPVPALKETVMTDWSQFTRTAVDVADFVRKQGRIPSIVWLGSVGVPPEAYLNALARVTRLLVKGETPGDTIEIKPARLAVARHVADDGPHLWGWVIFPKGFRAPALMEVAKRQAWTLKPALIDRATD